MSIGGTTYQPTPARSLDSGGLRVELLNELVARAPSLFNLLEEIAGRLLTSSARLGGQVLPEKSVVDVA